jgi:nitrite reductase (NADH) small subunit
MNVIVAEELKWIKACSVQDIPVNGGACFKYHDEQIAIFHFSSFGEWFATQNLCPHRQQMALSRGMIGSQNNEPKVACPFHKKTFSLTSGKCLSDDACESIKTYPVKLIDGEVYVGIK